LKNKFESQNELLNEEVFEIELKLKISAFCTHQSTKWKAKGVFGIEHTFVSKNKNWLTPLSTCQKLFVSKTFNYYFKPH